MVAPARKDRVPLKGAQELCVLGEGALHVFIEMSRAKGFRSRVPIANVYVGFWYHCLCHGEGLRSY